MSAASSTSGTKREDPEDASGPPVADEKVWNEINGWLDKYERGLRRTLDEHVKGASSTKEKQR